MSSLDSVSEDVNRPLQSTKEEGKEKISTEAENKRVSQPTDSDETSNPIKVHSANSWETADLGDSKRNEKFLRLLGAGKKEHHGKFVIGDHAPVHARQRKDDEHLAEELTEQYEHSLEHRLAGGRRGHLGLGFHPEDNPETEKTESTAAEESKEESKGEEEETEKGSNKTDDEKVQEQKERKRESSEGKKRDTPEESPGDAKKMKFVKSSS